MLTSFPAQGCSDVQNPFGSSPGLIQDGRVHTRMTDVIPANVDPQHQMIITGAKILAKEAAIEQLEQLPVAASTLDHMTTAGGPLAEGNPYVITPPTLLKAQDSAMKQAFRVHLESGINGRNLLKRNSRKKTIWYRDSVHASIFGRFYFTTQTNESKIYEEDVVENTETTSCCTFHPATWLISLGFTYVMNFSLRAPRPLISPARAVPDSALVFKLCEQGNVDAVRLLFERGEASVFDVDSDGWTPLHVSPAFQDP